MNTPRETSFSRLLAIPNPVVVCWPSPLALLGLLLDFELIDLADLQGTPFIWTPMPESICRTFATFTPSFEDIQYHATQISLFNAASTLVDLTPSSTQVPLLGFPKTAPPLTPTLLVHSKPRSPPKRHPLLSAREYHSPNMFRPCRSSRLRRFTPRSILQAYCILQPIMGFTTFQAFSFRRPDKSEDFSSAPTHSTRRLNPWFATKPRQDGDHPQWCAHPPKLSPY